MMKILKNLLSPFIRTRKTNPNLRRKTLCRVLDVNRSSYYKHLGSRSQYTVFFRQLLYSSNIIESFSKKRYPFDNACCECFFKYLKKEEINRMTYHTLQEPHNLFFEYIEGFYNSRKPHSSLNLHIPDKKRHLCRGQHKAIS